MIDDAIVLKGNREGLNVIININKFKDFDEMVESLIDRLSKGKRFYKGSTIKVTTQLRELNERDLRILKDILFDEFLIKDCIFEEIEKNENKVFQGIYEGRTKFIRSTVRSGQTIDYSGNLVIIGDVNPGAEIRTGGNIIVMGTLRGDAFAGSNGNNKAIIAAFIMQPQILQISDILARSPEDDLMPQYPEVARVKDGIIIVEPYLPNKYI